MILRFTKAPVRSIVLAQDESGDWVATYAGDPWCDAWETEAGPLWLVRNALGFDLTRGLPVLTIRPATKKKGRAA